MIRNPRYPLRGTTSGRRVPDEVLRAIARVLVVNGYPQPQVPDWAELRQHIEDFVYGGEQP